MAAESGLADAVRAINNLATAQVRKDTPSLIDVKGLGFTGCEKDFQQWSKKTEAFFAGVIKESEMMLLERAAEQPTEITTTAIDLGIQPSSLGIVPVLSLSDRIQLLHKLSVFTPPTAPLQCLGGREGGIGVGGQVEWPDLYVHRGECVVCVANLLQKTIADLEIQMLSTFGSFHPSGEEAHSFSITPVSCVTKRVEDIMPALQAYHARERESCDASPLRPCKNQAPLLICSWCKIVQNSMHLPYPMTSVRRLLADQPQNVALIYSSSEFPPFALLPIGSKVEDVTVHIQQEVVLCRWLLQVSLCL